MHVKNKHGLTIGEYNKKHMQVWIHDLVIITNPSILAAQCWVQWHKPKFWQGEEDWHTEGGLKSLREIFETLASTPF